jgi:hypothetical protein
MAKFFTCRNSASIVFDGSISNAAAARYNAVEDVVRFSSNAAASDPLGERTADDPGIAMPAIQARAP